MQLINLRWNPIKVSSIESVVVINKTYYTESESANINGVAVNLLGKLKDADIQISFKLPYSIPMESIASRVHTDTSISTEETTVEFGYIGKADEVSCVSDDAHNCAEKG